MTSLINAQNASLTLPLTSLIEDTLVMAEASRASSTAKQYASNWQSFVAFCTEHSLSPLPTSAQTVAVYLTALAREKKATSTIVSHLSAVKYFHERARHSSVNWSDPIISEVLSGIRRTSSRKVSKAAAILPEDLTTLLATTDEGIAGMRDRAILLIGFAGALRRSEITAITVENVEFVEEGMIIHLERSKTDQEGKGTEICIRPGRSLKTCPIHALRTWLEASKITSGPAFRRIIKGGTVGTEALSEEAVRLILAKAVAESGLQAKGRLSPHSLRSGFCTSAALAGRSLEQIARHARHVSVQTTLGYVRVAERFKDHAGEGLL